MNKTMLMAAAAVVLLAGAAGAAYYFHLFGGNQAEAAEASEFADETPAALLKMEAFLTNIADPSGERYARLSLKLVIAPEEKVAEIEGNDLLVARMRDVVLTLLSSKTYDELADPAGKEAFRKEIIQRLQPLAEGAEIREALFADFVVQ